MKSSNIGGQAVLEGIMMKNGKDYAVAVRKPDKEIEVKKDEYRSFIKWEKLTKIPFIRGIFNFIDSMVLGMKTLTYSASFYEEEETSRVLTEEEAKKQEKKNRYRDGSDSLCYLPSGYDSSALEYDEIQSFSKSFSCFGSVQLCNTGYQSQHGMEAR